jgi:hypothetical protein
MCAPNAAISSRATDLMGSSLIGGLSTTQSRLTRMLGCEAGDYRRVPSEVKGAGCGATLAEGGCLYN